MNAKHLFILALSVTWATAQEVTYLSPGQKAYFSSANYPSKYSVGSSFSKAYNTSAGNILNLLCIFHVPAPDILKMNLNAPTLSSGMGWTSTGPVRREWNSTGNALAVGLEVSSSSQGGLVNCVVMALGGPLEPALNITCGRRAPSSASRIINGTRVPEYEIPWQVRLFITTAEGTFLCGGSIIAPDWILTAAHCTFGATTVQVAAGNYDRTMPSLDQQVVYASRILNHESYDDTTLNNDIALLQLGTPLKYSDAVRPVCLPFNIQTKVFNGEVGTASGWGRTTPEGNTSDVLLKISTPIYDTEACQKFSAPGYSQVNSNMICSYQKDVDTCKGDSGGPLTWERACNGRSYVIGALSFHYGGCSIPDAPSVFTKVSRYLAWIETKTGASFNKV